MNTSAESRIGIVEVGANSALFTDLYELTMVRAYLELGMDDEAVFTLFARELPADRGYLLACGTETLIDQLESLRFTRADLDYLATLPQFDEATLGLLRDFRFTGSLRAVAEGTPVFPDEPILEITAPLPEAQLLETLVMNQVVVQSVLATKAARMVDAAEGRPVVDFGARRAHGPDAACLGARAFHVGGIKATSNLLAGRRYGLPVTGTMAHSFVQAHDDEMTALRNFTRVYPDTVLLVDTYDSLEGVRRVIRLADELGEDFRVQAIRLDSGDLAGLARSARALLDEAGLESVQIVASGGLDEWRIAELVASEAPIDSFGVGTALATSKDAPDLELVYKLAEYAGRGRLKLSSSKPVLPGRKQLFRQRDTEGRIVGDRIARAEETGPGEPLLELRMEQGRRTRTAPDLDAVRDHAYRERHRLPADLLAPSPGAASLPVEVSPALADFRRQVEQEVAEHD